MAWRTRLEPANQGREMLHLIVRGLFQVSREGEDRDRSRIEWFWLGRLVADRLDRVEQGLVALRTRRFQESVEHRLERESRSRRVQARLASARATEPIGLRQWRETRPDGAGGWPGHQRPP